MTNPPTFSLIRGEQRIDREALTAMSDELKESTASGDIVRVDDGSTENVLLAVLTLDGHCRRVELVPEGVALDPLVSEPHELDGPTEWVIYTSGTSGEPKAVMHTLESLSRAVKPSDGARIWGLVYDPHRLAGLAVVLQALATESTLVDVRAGSITEKVDAMRSAGVTALSATPTLWRQMLQTGRTSGWALERITLGGEVSDQHTLDALAAEFPQARITHIFAASETGVAFAVGDGREGFPHKYLLAPPRGVALEIRDNILWVQSPNSSLAGADGFASTDDVVEIVGDRVLFIGRSSGMVNVGGSKVFPEQVESIIRKHPSIVDALVFSKRNPFSGNILLAKVIVNTEDPDIGPADIRRWVATQVPTHMVPAQVEIVDDLPKSSNGKVVRS
jgi:acyl-coenzyme A synthetase/AMP-(fatty) acid ligase